MFFFPQERESAVSEAYSKGVKEGKEQADPSKTQPSVNVTDEVSQRLICYIDWPTDVLLLLLRILKTYPYVYFILVAYPLKVKEDRSMFESYKQRRNGFTVVIHAVKRNGIIGYYCVT